MPVWAPGEEIANSATHAVGAVLSILGIHKLIRKGIDSHDEMTLIAYTVFGISLIVLYSASALYHGVTYMPIKKSLRYFDHCSVYLLIAGTYTAFSLTTLRGKIGYVMLAIIWIIALIGMLSKIFFFDAVDKYTVLFYVSMGWLIVLTLKTLIHRMKIAGIEWLLAGGISCTLGTYFYSQNLPFYHAIFHIFILLGTTCDYIACLKYT